MPSPSGRRRRQPLRYTAGPPVQTLSAAPTAINNRRAAVLVAAAIAAFLAVGARWWWADSAEGRQLRPRPDALEYAAAAQSIAQNGTYFLQIGPAQVRPRYPPGWPLILAAALRLGVRPESLWRIPGLLAGAQSALMALLAGMACARLVGESDPLARRARWAPVAAALLAGAAWALAPAAVVVGRTVVSDQAAVLFALIALLATGAWIAGPRATGWRSLPLLGGLALGATCGVRPIQAVAIAPGLALFLLWGWRRRRMRPAAVAAWTFGALAFPALVAALLWRSGIPVVNWSDYRLWVPERFSGAAATFDIANALGGNQERALKTDGSAAAHLELGLRVLAGAPGLQGNPYVGQYWPLLGWVCLTALLGPIVRGHPARRVAGWSVAAVTLAHLAIFSTYFYPAGRFYLLAMVAPIVALAVTAGWLLAHPRWQRIAIAPVLLWAGLMAVQFGAFQAQPGGVWPDEPTKTGFRRWVRWGDQARSQRVMPFDPVHAQALGLLRPAVFSRIQEWGLLPETQHVRRLRASGVLDYRSFRVAKRVTGVEPAAPHPE